MTKQEEIRKGIETQISLFFKGNPSEFQWSVDRLTKYIVEYLDSQGVVIKVERELPHVEMFCQLARVECIPKLAVQQDMLKAGYVPVEPLK